MKKALFALLALIFLSTGIYALCDSGQIDINSASLEELDKITGVGPVYADRIIQGRPFSSVENLIDVVGIGNITLEKIKAQNLACVEGQEESVKDDENSEENISYENNSVENNISYEEPPEENKNILEDKTTNDHEKIEIVEDIVNETLSITGEEVKTIILNPKDIKSETDKEQLNKSKLATYGIIGFCILLVSLFTFKKRNKDKNEFK